MAAPASGQIVITGFLKTGAEPVEIDSAYFQYGTQDTWFTTPDWHCDPMASDTFVFPPFANFPSDVKLAAKFNGQPLVQDFPSPSRAVWYPFWDPHDGTQAMFDAPDGIEEDRRNPTGPYLVVNPSVVSDAAVILTAGTGCLELVDAAGNTVRTIRAAARVRWTADDDGGRALPGGIYFCRLTTGQTTTVRKLILAR
jgi:hypothetical protein